MTGPFGLEIKVDAGSRGRARQLSHVVVADINFSVDCLSVCRTGLASLQDKSVLFCDTAVRLRLSIREELNSWITTCPITVPGPQSYDSLCVSLV